jgi:microcystin degradation protein MlrC
MRIAIGGIQHESSDFSPVETPLSEFLADGRWFDAEMLRRRPGDTNTVIDGFIKGVRKHGVEMVPLFWTHAPSARQPTFETHQSLKARLLEPLRAALPVDGVLLSLHGGYSVQGLDDGDGDILKAVRQLVGPDCPIMAVHDPHCNVGPDMIENANALIIMDTYPHVDMAERAVEATALMVRTIRGEIRPTMAWCSLPMFWSASKMISAEEPIRSAYECVFEIERRPGVLVAGIGLGYQWADNPTAGASTIVVTDGNRQSAQETADELGHWLWERRADWQRQPMAPPAALDEGECIGRYPIILADQADNPGGGAPSDNTEILRLFIERDLQDAAVLYIRDRETVQTAKAAGVGARVDVEVGGKSHPLSAPPVPMQAEVLAVSDGRFIYDGPMWAGREGNHGDSVLLKQDGIYVAVISEMYQPMDLAFPRSLGLDCRTLRYICVKSTGHFRSGFGPIAGSIFNVDALGVFTQDFARLPFERLGRKIYPIDPDAAW